MEKLIDAAFAQSRAVYLILLFVLLFGVAAYISIPKEAEPDVTIPVIYVSMTHDGISPEDSERLLVRPMEKELQSIEGIKVMTGTAGEGHGSVMLEFYAGFDNKKALADVRERVDIARNELPEATDEPVVTEVNVALMPVLVVSLSGAVPERTLVTLARDLKDRIEGLTGVLEVDIGGDREPLLEVIVDPNVMETYNVKFDELFSLVSTNNLLVAAGAVDTASGRFVVKVPGVIEDVNDIMNIPVKVEGENVVTLGQVASVRKTFKDPQGFARVNDNPAVTLEVKKRLGANIIETVTDVRELVAEVQEFWPADIDVHFMQDKSSQIRTWLSDLQNNILFGFILVMVVIILALGPRSALLVGLAIPGSFLASILVLEFFGFTMNMIVLFSLILVVGMLVDGAIVVSELATRYMSEGKPAKQAYADASKRMSWPIIGSTMTTLAVFFPLLFWPGLVGQFMSYLPITVIICLIASLAMALIFVPVVGGTFGRSDPAHGSAPGAVTQWYAGLLSWLLRRPGWTLLVALGIMMSTYVSYGMFGKGMEFFPEIEPDFAMVQVRARGDMSVYEKDALVRQVEQRIQAVPGVDAIYARSFIQAGGENQAEDVVGVVQLQFMEWGQRPSVDEILGRMRTLTADIPGLILEFRKAEEGPAQGKPIQLEFSARDPALIPPAVNAVKAKMRELGGFIDVEENLPLPGIEWRLLVDREKAARYGANVALLGNAVQMVTNGIMVTEYRPDDADDEVEIRVRFPLEKRNLDQLEQLKVPTGAGMVPASNFIRLEPAQKTGTLTRVDGRRAATLKADVAEGVLVNDKLIELREQLASTIDSGVQVRFKGQDEDQREAMNFLISAFITAVFLMFLILVLQFNSLYQAVLVLSAIVFSTAGVLLGLLVTAQPFGIVMVGIGIIALAGIVVNNNIVLIDTYNRQRRMGKDPVTAAVYTGQLRLRPVFLTAITTVLGLMPMVLAMTFDIVNRDISFGAPSTQWWTQLSSAIAGGLTFATLLTLLLTPCLLVLGEKFIARIKRTSEVMGGKLQEQLAD